MTERTLKDGRKVLILQEFPDATFQIRFREGHTAFATAGDFCPEEPKFYVAIEYITFHHVNGDRIAGAPINVHPQEYRVMRDEVPTPYVVMRRRVLPDMRESGWSVFSTPNDEDRIFFFTAKTLEEAVNWVENRMNGRS